MKNGNKVFRLLATILGAAFTALAIANMFGLDRLMLEGYLESAFALVVGSGFIFYGLKGIDVFEKLIQSINHSDPHDFE